jgi:hypothetical protein
MYDMLLIVIMLLNVYFRLMIALVSQGCLYLKLNKRLTYLPKCILHVLSMFDHGPFPPLSEIKGTASEKLQQLHKIRDRRLHQAHESPYRMQSACYQIPTTLLDDLESAGYHHQCYQHFTGNLHLLGDDTEPEASTSQWHHSPRKLSSAGSAGPIFPPECIFCERVEIKGGDRKIERAEDLEEQRKCMGANRITGREMEETLLRLHRLVKNTDLFAVEAKHHPSCLRSFRTAFAIYERGIFRAEGAKDTDHTRMSAAHEKALVSILEHIQTHMVRQNEVLRLSSLRLLYARGA